MSAVPTHNEANASSGRSSADPAGAELVSAFMDGEAQMPDSLLRTSSARHHWYTYHLIGDVLRSDALARPATPEFTQKLAKAIAAEPPIVAPKRRTRLRAVARYGVPGVALAAAVVAVTWMAQPLVAPSGRTLQASSTPPEGTFTAASLSATPVLVDYLDAHRHTAGFSTVGSQVDLDAGRR